MEQKAPSDTRVLLVDDEPAFREVLAFSFKRMGYQILSASNGREAYALVQERPVDVVISDIRMPNGDGVELLDRLKEQSSQTPIVLLVTGFAELSVEQAREKGAEALFSKPFNPGMLRDAVSKLLTPAGECWTRLSDRIEVELMTELQFPGLPEIMDAKVLSLSKGGMFLAIPERENLRVNVHDSVSFRIKLDNTSSPLEGSGVVRWVRIQSSPSLPGGYGIEFTALAESVKLAVGRFVELKKSMNPIKDRK